MRKIKSMLKNLFQKTFVKIGLFLFLIFIFWNLNLESITDNNKNLVNNVEASGLMDYLYDGASWTGYALMHPDKWFVGMSNTITGAATDALVDTATRPIVWGFNWLLYGVLALLSKLLIVSGALIDKTLDQNLFIKVINEDLYLIWAFVRDFLNIFFIILLLFSAFATIFQVEKYHLRKVIIMLVVMALLVNFSYPISLFIIDFSNSAMYFLVDQIHNVTGTTNKFSESVLISNITNYGRLQDSGITGEFTTTTTLLGLITFTFILFITMVAIGLNLAIRIIAFMILIVLSPAGFAFAFFPDTKNIANDWWSALFKYAFMGPIMVFFLLMAIVVFENTSVGSLGDKGAFLEADLINFIFVISFLWIGLIAANKFGGSASNAAMGFAKKTGNNIKTYGQKAAWSGFASTGIPGAFKERYADIKGGFSKSRENREAKLASLMGSKSALSDLERKRYEEDAKKMKNYNNKDLEAKAEKGNIAAADELLSRKSLTPEIFNKAITNSKDDKRNADLIAKFKGTNKDSRIDVVASIDARKNARDEKIIAKTMSDHGLSRDKAEEKVLEDEIKNRITKMNQKDFISQDFEKIYKSIDEKLASSNRLDNVEGYAIRDSIHEAFRGLDANGARGDIIKNLSKNQYAELDKDGVV